MFHFGLVKYDVLGHRKLRGFMLLACYDVFQLCLLASGGPFGGAGGASWRFCGRLGCSRGSVGELLGSLARPWGGSWWPLGVSWGPWGVPRESWDLILALLKVL